MTVYVDDMRRQARVGRLNARWSHLMADDTDELLAFAARLGLRPEWIQHKGKPIEHFDVTDPKRDLAIRLGATRIGYGREGAQITLRKAAALKAARRAASPGEET